jgi:hypothetical protein
LARFGPAFGFQPLLTSHVSFLFLAAISGGMVGYSYQDLIGSCTRKKARQHRDDASQREPRPKIFSFAAECEIASYAQGCEAQDDYNAD